jgi:hypothetical protein
VEQLQVHRHCPFEKTNQTISVRKQMLRGTTKNRHVFAVEQSPKIDQSVEKLVLRGTT